MTVRQALIWASKILKTGKIKTASLDAEVLLSFTINKPKEFAYTHPEKKLTKKQLINFKNLINQRLAGKPVAYLRNAKEFYDRDFYVDNNVLIPRPETEILVDETLIKAKKYKPQTIADIGTGSGCVAITLAKKLPKAKIYAVDISQKALDIAKKNAKKHKVKINFFQGDLINPLNNKKVDIMVANLPYGWKQWNNINSAANSSLKFEPPISLFTKEKGLYLYRRLFEQINKRRQKPSLILCEFDPRQKNDLQKIIKKYLPNSKLEIKKDLARLNRIFIIKN